jgi:DNA repair protein RecN (Recombination protein N)
MLTSLRLKNFAVVEEMEVAFAGGLTVLTGETGAGKSILIDALGLLVGGRAEAEVIRSGADEASMDAIFSKSPGLAQRLAELGLPDDGPELSVRRTVGRTGRGRAYVNGALVTVGVLQRLMRGLVDIGGQHEHMALFDAAEHLGLIDRFGGVGEAGPMGKYLEAWARLKDVDSRLAALGGDEGQVRQRIDFLTFQLEEIDRVAPTAGEDTALEGERRKLVSGERLRTLAANAEELVSTRDGAALEQIGRALHFVVDAEKVDPSLESIRQTLITAQGEVDEAARSLSRYLSALEADPARLEVVEDRLDALRRLARKHAAPLDEVIARRATLATELETLAHRAERRVEVEAERTTVLAEVTGLAQLVTAARKKASQKLSEVVQTGLGRLAMARASFVVEFSVAPLSSTGADAVQLLFSANPGEPPRALSKVASGGEASRVMLAIKAALAGTDACVCSVFDEADAGIGGAVADVVGRLIKDISSHRQVLCITHLPQVAAHADAHLRIEKGEQKGRTRSVVQVLEGGEARAHELARMLSGVEITREALGAAEALLRSATRTVRPMRARKRAEGRRLA